MSIEFCSFCHERLAKAVECGNVVFVSQQHATNVQKAWIPCIIVVYFTYVPASMYSNEISNIFFSMYFWLNVFQQSREIMDKFKMSMKLCAKQGVIRLVEIKGGRGVVADKHQIHIKVTKKAYFHYLPNKFIPQFQVSLSIFLSYDTSFNVVPF